MVQMLTKMFWQLRYSLILMSNVKKTNSLSRIIWNKKQG
jgi:hypothetical protein